MSQKKSSKISNNNMLSLCCREKDMDHAVRIPEIGVSKVHLSTPIILQRPTLFICVLQDCVTLLTVNCVWFQFHAEVHFDQEQQCYMLVDQGSQNGTVINGNRILQVCLSLLPLNKTKPQLNNYTINQSPIILLQPKTKCEPHALMHGDEVKMGETVLSFHIHSGTDTCDGCEPGQVMAHIGKHRREEQTGEATVTDTAGSSNMLKHV